MKKEIYINEEIIKDCDKLPNKIKISLEKGKEIENNWNNNTLPLLINNCINIENNSTNIKLLNENIGKINNSKLNMKFYPQEEGINKFLDSIKIFGKISELDKIKQNIIINKKKFEEPTIQSTLTNIYLKATAHKHPLEIIKRFLGGWICDICRTNSNQDNPSYHCTMCDFDLCTKCAEKYIKEGKAKKSNSLNF